jgi:hypothetical protein
MLSSTPRNPYRQSSPANSSPPSPANRAQEAPAPAVEAPPAAAVAPAQGRPRADETALAHLTAPAERKRRCGCAIGFNRRIQGRKSMWRRSRSPRESIRTISRRWGKERGGGRGSRRGLGCRPGGRWCRVGGWGGSCIGGRLRSEFSLLSFRSSEHAGRERALNSQATAIEAFTNHPCEIGWSRSGCRDWPSPKGRALGRLK